MVAGDDKLRTIKRVLRWMNRKHVHGNWGYTLRKKDYLKTTMDLEILTALWRH